MLPRKLRDAPCDEAMRIGFFSRYEAK
jgi:hypothetical protein